MSSDLLCGSNAAPVVTQLRRHAPLVHCITNDVVQNFTANVLLALGASPAMVVDTEEAAQFAAIADALLINLGTLTHPQQQAMRAAIDGACAAGKPWTLDPVAVGALTLRTEFAREILARRPAAIRGNASEIRALAGESGGGRGVDATESAHQAREAARLLARRTGAVVAVTGEVDYITDGERTVAVEGGTGMLTRVVGTGCALSAVVAACCALPGDRLENVATACWLMKRAGEQALTVSRGPGSFASALLDNLHAQAFGGAHETH
ncbi:hydroxyethylthiazole kinase [Cronobacter malonaticus]|uniref:Hydroxyethylthiazole kinase n=4 Tax=Cronobacter malonaticus TaxID=413503 RepID=V5TYZ8_9ENTR|nr:hydroxyethylthiazole kinase [Cronobacter malonaticus]CCJ93297.1 Hydroxyethylthiazole kinase [Cronobacter malonaticus 681]AHB69784.1 hydroxyethylthiazole kinase [Cronobacter malonaticus]ALX78003.1 hydroxyethylthiazole kinase [Cronobacter malonaticus LMG 23826]EGT4281094.1 hydroxyethylthiazole kinase [Cronobacter malonaticus]EGT4288588.1 hydroxyethylthiazole kinase [Cronobacter malonaticus]